MPTFNSAATLDDALRSIYQQHAAMNGDLAQIRLVDGVSTDETLAIAEAWRIRFKERSGSLDTDLKFCVISEPDKGIYDAMNKGLRGVLKTAQDDDLIAILNSDDRYTDKALSLIAEAAEKHPEAGLFYGNMGFMDASGEPIDARYPVRPRLNPRSFADGMPLAHPASFIRAHAYRAHGLFDTQYRIAADYDLCYRFIRAGVTSLHLTEVLALMREGGVSTDPAFETASYKECIAVRVAAGAPKLREWLRYYRKRLNRRLYQGAAHLPGVEGAYERYKSR